MIIDAYSLVGTIPIRSSPVDFPQLFTEMASTGVNHAMVASLRGLHADARKGNNHLFGSIAGDPRIFPVGVVAPLAGTHDMEKLIEDCIENNAQALAFSAEPSISFSSLNFQRTLQIAARSKLPLIAYGATKPGTPSELANLTSTLGCRLLLSGSIYLLLDELLAVLDKYDHVYIDTSWQITPGSIELLVEHAGSERILFGSGAPIRPIRPALNTVLDTNIEDKVKRKILGSNALRFLGRYTEANAADLKPMELPQIMTPSTSPIDVHNHFGSIPGVSATVRDIDAIQLFAKKYHMEYSVCSSYVAYHEDIEAGNVEMLENISRHSNLLGSPVISPTHIEASINWLDMFQQNDRLAHATLMIDTVLERPGSQPYMKLFSEAAARKIPIFLNGPNRDPIRVMSWPKGPGFAPFEGRSAAADVASMLLEVGQRHPNLPIILGHGMGEDGIELVKKTNNIYLELSGSFPEAGAVRRAIDRVGADRIVFGSDLDVIVPAYGLGIYYEANLSPQEDQKIMAKNARRILRMPKN
ncbi:amidohydrolase family protein [bacterium]|nr:amidohydrolase family protein [bacterium]